MIMPSKMHGKEIACQYIGSIHSLLKWQ